MTSHSFGKQQEALPEPRTHVVKTLQQLELQRLQRTFNAWKQRRWGNWTLDLSLAQCPLIILAGWVFDSNLIVICRDLTGFISIYPYISRKSTSNIWVVIYKKQLFELQASPPTTGCWHVVPWVDNSDPSCRCCWGILRAYSISRELFARSTSF